MKRKNVSYEITARLPLIFYVENWHLIYLIIHTTNMKETGFLPWTEKWTWTNSSHHHSYTPFLNKPPVETNKSFTGEMFMASSPQKTQMHWRQASSIFWVYLNTETNYVSAKLRVCLKWFISLLCKEGWKYATNFWDHGSIFEAFTRPLAKRLTPFQHVTHHHYTQPLLTEIRMQVSLLYVKTKLLNSINERSLYWELYNKRNLPFYQNKRSLE